MEPKLLIAVDIGGTKTAVALVDQAGAILNRVSEPTSQNGPAAGFQQIIHLIENILGQAGKSAADCLGIGVGIAAVLDSDDRIVWAPNISGWRDVDLRTALSRHFGIPAYLEYDGQAAVLGEWWLGAAQGYRSVGMLIIGTGIGGGLILDGKLFRGSNRLAGAAGWFAMTDKAASDDARGQALGHFESLAAGPGIAAQAAAGLAAHGASSLNQCHPLTAKEVFDHARKGDAFASEIVGRAADTLGLGVANLISLVNPEIVVLGGSVGNQGDLLVPRIRVVAQRWAQPIAARSAVITSSSLGSEAGLYGAAYVVLIRAQNIGV
jgi:glucokinase